jgi:ribosomal protein L40E
MEEMMETVSSQRVCSSCGTTNSGSGKFCIKCGALLLPGSSPAPAVNVSQPSASPKNPPVNRQGKIKYEPQIIENFAVSLYRAAKIILILFTLIGILGGGVGAYVLGGEIVWAIGGAVLLGLVLFGIAWQIAFRLKLRAQLALCQVQIEENSR